MKPCPISLRGQLLEDVVITVPQGEAVGSRVCEPIGIDSFGAA